MSLPLISEMQGTTNLLSRALAAVDKKLDVIPDPTQLSYHLPASQQFPKGLRVQVGACSGLLLGVSLCSRVSGACACCM